MDYQMPIRHTVVMTDETARRVVDAAVPALRAMRYEVGSYEAGVGACNGNYVVEFVQRGARPNENRVGNPGDIPGLSVTISGATLDIVTTGLVR